MITDAGFELVSEALYLGEKLLVKPLSGQMEQASNAPVVRMLDLRTVMKNLDPDSVFRFLQGPRIAPKTCPGVACMIAVWIGRGKWADAIRRPALSCGPFLFCFIRHGYLKLITKPAADQAEASIGIRFSRDIRRT